MELRENELDVDTYLALRKSVGWKKLSRKQAQLALENSLYVLVAYEEDKPVGMGRIVGDGAVICYVQDLLICPDYRKRGIGGKILEELKHYVQTLRLDNTELMFGLMCAKGREAFYESHGFLARPTKELGPGMIQYLREEE